MSQDNSWQCGVCSRQFKMKRDLRRHIESLHVGNHPGYECEVCGIHKMSENALRMHKRNIHGSSASHLKP